MARPRRKLLAALALILAVASPALAAERIIEASKVLIYLQPYLKLPPAERNHFTLAYYLRVGGEPLAAPVALVVGDRRIPIPVSPRGKLERLPSLAELDGGKLAFGFDPATKINLTLGIEPLVTPAMDLDAHELAAAVAQATTGERKVAGVMAMVMPKLSNVGFVGVTSGEVEFADGRRAPLPTIKGLVAYDPAAQPNAKRIHLPKVPDRLEIN
jgi:hypothetical protein